MTAVKPLYTLALSEEERTQLISLLAQVLKDTRVEAHRTDAPDYREWIERRESALQDVINRLRAMRPEAGDRREVP